MSRVVRIACLLILMGLTALSSRAVSAPNPKDAEVRLNGGFIQYDHRTRKLTNQQWETVLDEMDSLGMTVVILNYLGVAVDDQPAKAAPWMITPGDPNDPTAVMLARAEKLNRGRAEDKKFQVYLGLLAPPVAFELDDKGLKVEVVTNGRPGWWGNPAKKQFASNLDSFATANANFAKEVWHRYGGAGACKGWYIPLENWVGYYGFDPSDKWTEFYSTVTTACKAAGGKDTANMKVAISPCLPHWRYRKDFAEKDGAVSAKTFPAAAAKQYAELLQGTGLDVVMLQDSIGARCLEETELVTAEDKKTYPGRLTPQVARDYLEQMQKAFKAEKLAVELWANFESYETEPGNRRVPCSFDRLAEQLAATRGLAAKRVTFDFFHYMNNRVFLPDWGEPGGSYRKRMMQLHDHYKNQYVP